jgi:hypothetical protein
LTKIQGFENQRIIGESDCQNSRNRRHVKLQKLEWYQPSLCHQQSVLQNHLDQNYASSGEKESDSS